MLGGEGRDRRVFKTTSTLGCVGELEVEKEETMVIGETPIGRAAGRN